MILNATKSQIENVLEKSNQAFHVFRRTSRYMRSQLLFVMVQEMQKRRADLVSSIIREVKKPRIFAEVEVSRAVTTFTLAAEESKRYAGEVIPIDIEASGRPYAPAVSLWFPRGPVLAITPFNFPLNLVAHKVAPALAVGCPVVLKPAPQAPETAKILQEIFETARMQVEDEKEKIPSEVLQVLSCSNELASQMVTDARIKTVSFTGSAKVGWEIQKLAVQKRVLLELGGNAAVIIDQDADLNRAAIRCAIGAFAYAGQVCISVQRIYVQENIYKKFLSLLIDETKKLKVGDPLDKDTVVGPVIDTKAADRITKSIEEAKKHGACVEYAESRYGDTIPPVILSNVSKHLDVLNTEVFGPVVIVESYKEFHDAIRFVNDSVYGLQAGVFTESQRKIEQAIEEIDVGAVLINEIPMYRADQMPYGGIKESGLGREGVKYAMEEYSERKVVVRWRG